MGLQYLRTVEMYILKVMDTTIWGFSNYVEFWEEILSERNSGNFLLEPEEHGNLIFEMFDYFQNVQVVNQTRKAQQRTGRPTCIIGQTKHS